MVWAEREWVLPGLYGISFQEHTPEECAWLPDLWWLERETGLGYSGFPLPSGGLSETHVLAEMLPCCKGTVAVQFQTGK